jgi:hypothetical protein
LVFGPCVIRHEQVHCENSSPSQTWPWPVYMHSLT